MSDVPPNPANLITELQASAHLMQLDAGIYCVHHTPGSLPPDPQTGLPGARLSVPPGSSGKGVSITGFRDDGWLGSLDSAALIRVSQGPAQVLMTIYQAKGSNHEPPRLQVTKLVEGLQTVVAQRGTVAPPPPEAPPADTPDPKPVSDAEIAAHVQLRGDVLARLGDWVGDRGSQRWIEGFALSPRRGEVLPEDIEYQAVLGRGWLSPWAEGGQYCGSRGMALPILGLRVRLRGAAAATHTVRVSATFTDGSAIGPLGPGGACEAESLAPLEAFCVTVVPLSDAEDLPEAAPAEPLLRRPAKAAAKPVAPVKPVARVAKPEKRAVVVAKPAKAAPAVAQKPKARAAVAAKKPAAPPPRGRGR